LAATFVFPRHVDYGVLQKAIGWFAQARGQDAHAMPGDFDGQRWRAIPFTRKPALRAQLEPYLETGSWITRLSSSGTTAEPVVSPWSEADQQVADATARAIHAHCPSIDGARCAVIAPGPTLAVTHSMLREIELCGGIPCLIEPHDPETVCRKLVEEATEVVFTLPLVASRIGEYFTATRGAVPEDIRLVFCGGDVLSAARQSMLAHMWDAVVLNMFGCSELFGPIAGPGEQGGPLIWRCEPVAVEVIDPTTLAPCGLGQRGVMVLSTLWPKASPLLRYWTDDTVELTDIDFSAETFVFDFIGRPPSILSIAGRQVSLRDIDNALLSCRWCTSEWSIRQTAEEVLIEAEMPRRKPALLRSAREALREIVGVPVDLVPQQPGSLPRSIPKFTILKEQSEQPSGV
jgi:phenylacetate-coenzyme A ligase PaaK-like adenylate-forming protein